jgi:hypothetical protein
MAMMLADAANVASILALIVSLVSIGWTAKVNVRVKELTGISIRNQSLLAANNLMAQFGARAGAGGAGGAGGAAEGPNAQGGPGGEGGAGGGVGR